MKVAKTEARVMTVPRHAAGLVLAFDDENILDPQSAKFARGA
jgi:hypothetical protein